MRVEATFVIAVANNKQLLLLFFIHDGQGSELL